MSFRFIASNFRIHRRLSMKFTCTHYGCQHSKCPILSVSSENVNNVDVLFLKVLRKILEYKSISSVSVNPEKQTIPRYELLAYVQVRKLSLLLPYP